jgi:NADPH-dependent 2,4-dienoyl-CoA reductase/sulfur reductase-like enzyme/rhodanese-related sulfurtransferase
MGKRVLIVGGVAAGASCAARLRRIDEDAEIIVYERGPYVSFANCGLPYYVGDVIQKEPSLLLASPELFKARFNIEVRTEHEVTAIDREHRTIKVKNLGTGGVVEDTYHDLVLAPGAAPIRPPLPGIDLPGIFTLRSIPDSREIRGWIDEHHARRAVVVGGGLVGLETAENLVHRGMQVTVVEMLHQVLPPLDPEMTQPINDHLAKNGITLHLGDAVASFSSTSEGGLRVSTRSGQCFDADIVVLSIGVRPETGLAQAAGLELGERGGIQVDAQMRTSDPHIFAAGDAVEVPDLITGRSCLMPLAGPANRQGRVAAEVICGRESSFKGVLGTTVCGLFGMTVATTGANEKALQRAGIASYKRIYLHPGHHVDYYPGAKPIHMKLLFSGHGHILGAQAVGYEGVEKRIDVIAMAIQRHATVFDLEEGELCYAPQFGAAKDPVNLAGMIAANVLRGDVTLARWEDLGDSQSLLLDVRETSEFEAGHIPGAINIPLPQLRARIKELPRQQPIWVYCGVGQRSYYALRLLTQRGFTVRNLSGGLTTYKHRQALLSTARTSAASNASGGD